MRGLERYTHNSVGTLRTQLLTTWAGEKTMGRKVTFGLNFEEVESS